MWKCSICLKKVDDGREPIEISEEDLKACSNRCRKIYHEAVTSIQNALNGREKI